MAANFVGHVADLLTLKANWFDTLTVKQWEVMINNDVYSQTSLNGHPLNMDTSLFRQFALSLGKESPDTFYGPHRVRTCCIKGLVKKYRGGGPEHLEMWLIKNTWPTPSLQKK